MTDTVLSDEGDQSVWFGLLVDGLKQETVIRSSTDTRPYRQITPVIHLRFVGGVLGNWSLRCLALGLEIRSKLYKDWKKWVK